MNEGWDELVEKLSILPQNTVDAIKKIAMGYKVIKKEVNQFIGEIEINDFIQDFETIIENNSNEDVNIKSMTIIVK